VLTAAPPTRARPVLLATFDVAVLDQAAALAVDSSVENGQPLVVVNVIGGRFFPTPGVPVPEPIVLDEVEASLRAPAQLAASLGVRAERLRVLTPRPVEALIELVAEREPGLLVIGADPSKMPKRRYARALSRIRERTACLVWPG
jgi:nucleotide-binding universal stress UspA family protein